MREPNPRLDDWLAGRPESVGLDPERLETAGAEAFETRPNLLALAIFRHQRRAYQRFRHPTSPNQRMPVLSITKSFLSTLTGIALGEGWLRLDERWIDVLPEYAGVISDSRLGLLRIEHLLTMTSGLQPDPQDRPGHGHDWIRSILRQGFVAHPGERFAYATAVSTLLAAAVARRSGTSIRQLAEERLFGPLGVESARWPADRTGAVVAGGLELTIADLAKLGLLYMQAGRWGAQQIVPSWYVDRATRPQAEGGLVEDAAYGYHWWVDVAAGRGNFFAAGYGGQYLYVSRPLHLIVILISDAHMPPPDSPSALIAQIRSAAA